MPLDVLTYGEALVEIMRAQVDAPLHAPASFIGPFPSGAPFIFAVQAARLGARAGAIGCVGADPDGAPDAFGRCLLDQLHDDGVEQTGVLALPGYTTGAAFIGYRSDGTRNFIFHLRHAAAGQLHPGLLERGEIAALFHGLKCLHVMGSTLSIHADALALGERMLRLAREAGAVISFDPNLRPQLLPASAAKQAFAPFAATADVLLPTAEEAMLLTGEATPQAAAEALLAAKPGRIVVITHGAAGCTVYAEGSAVQVPGFIVDEIDPTGAGDCFDAGFLVHWLAGAPPAQAARLANACGALAVMQRGPMAGAATTAQLRTFLATAQQRI
jgi:sugar/nucleoside kinase (ribokinase family)